jgi:iron-sulfur cluster assembly protein
MLNVSEEALEKIKQFLEGQKGARSIRILMTDEGGWKGPYLVMALDEKKNDDMVITEKGVTFLIEKALFEKVKPIRIGYTHSTLGLGFTIESELMKLAKDATTGCHDIYPRCDDLVSK